MAKFRLERVLPYEVAQLYDMVGDVERYPDFVPWITRLTAYNRKSSGEINQFDADVHIGFKLLSEKFSTRVVRDARTRTVTMALIRGPFRKLDGRWTFVAEGTGSRAILDIDVEIRNPILDAIFRANYDKAADKLMALFEQRAGQLYAGKH